MALLRTHMDFATFLDYHGTTITDPLLYNYIESFDNFCKFQSEHYFQSADKTTTLINENNTPSEQAVQQLVADYLDDDIQRILNVKPIDNFINSPTSPRATKFPPSF